MATSDHDPAVTHPSIFLRLKDEDSETRELAWEEFRTRYAPIIAGFARNLGAGAQDIDDIIQEVMLGFFRVAPKFSYDPKLGRFRGYLKTCTLHELGKCRSRSSLKLGPVPLEQVAPEANELDELWEQQWRTALTEQALEKVRAEQRGSRTFRAFELHILEQHSADDVARQLGISRNGVQQAKHRILQDLRRKVKCLSLEI